MQVINPQTDEPTKGKLLEERFNLSKESEQLTTEKHKLEAEYSRSRLNNAEQWLNRRHITSREQLMPYAERLAAARVDYVVLVRIPFFGIVIDVNDLGVLGGFTFLVVLMWFRFSLWREYYNLSSTFKAAKNDEDLHHCYSMLAMSQVLTVPPALEEHQPKERPWGKIVRVLYFLPITVLVVIFIYDWKTVDFGLDTNRSNTLIGISMNLAFVGMSSLLTYWCFRLSAEIDQVWEQTAQRLQPYLAEKGLRENS